MKGPLGGFNELPAKEEKMHSATAHLNEHWSHRPTWKMADNDSNSGGQKFETFGLMKNALINLAARGRELNELHTATESTWIKALIGSHLRHLNISLVSRPK